MKNRDILIIVSAYNEEENLEKLFINTHKKMLELNRDYKLYIVNDGSTDKSKTIIESFRNKYPVELINVDIHKGVGNAFNLGFRLVLDSAKEESIILTKEADNTSNLNIMGDLINAIESQNDIALASCYANKGAVLGTTYSRIILSKIANFMLKTLFPIIGVNTYSSFYRAYNLTFLKKAFEFYGTNLITESGFVCMAEMLIKFNKLGAKIVEIPMVLHCNFRKGKSKMKCLVTVISYFKLFFKLNHDKETN